MLNVTVLFLLFSGIVFFGYVLNALFSRIKIVGILPLMLIGLLIGPILHLLSTSSSSTISEASPYVGAIAIAFVLFEAGMSIRLSTLRAVVSKTSKFTFSLAIFTGIVLGLVFWLDMHWSLVLAFVGGFALAGPSSIILPTLVRLASVNSKLKSSLLFESVITDSVQLIVPIILLSIVVAGNVNIPAVLGMLFNFLISSTVFGIAFAFFWVFILKQFAEYSKGYSWMLTITMVIAAYGIAQAIGLNGAVATFVFGIFLANIPYLSEGFEKYTYNIQKEFIHIKVYQKEIVFFVSTFFFVYIGLLVNLSQISIFLIAVSIAASIAVLGARILFLPMLNSFFAEGAYSERIMAGFDVSRGLSPAIIATMPAALGIVIPGFLDTIFMVILLTNIITTIGMFVYARRYSAEKAAAEGAGAGAAAS